VEEEERTHRVGGGRKRRGVIGRSREEEGVRDAPLEEGRREKVANKSFHGPMKMHEEIHGGAPRTTPSFGSLPCCN